MWFRYHIETLDDPKVQRLPAEYFRVWVNLLCIAKRFDGEMPPESDCAFMLRMNLDAFHETFEALKVAGLFDVSGGQKKTTKPHNWSKRQYKSDSSTERVKRFRKRSMKPPCNAPETPPEQNRAEKKETKATALAKNPPEVEDIPNQLDRRSDGKRGTRLAENWQPDEQDRGFARKHGLDSDQLAEQFINHWTAAVGKGATARDWHAKWRTWCLNEVKWTAQRMANQPSAGGVVSVISELVAQGERGG